MLGVSLIISAAIVASVLAHPDAYYRQAVKLMEESPLIDTHIDLPQVIRSLNRKPLDGIPQLAETLPGHVDIPRLREGRLGGAFWTVWAPCPDTQGEDPGRDFNTPTSGLRDSLEMLDLIQNMISRHPQHLQYAHSSADIKSAFAAGKIASLLGMEGTHLLGNSLGVLRVFAQLGVRYLTLTHSCHSSFASSAGYGHPGLVPVHADNGLTDLGSELIKELNRLGIMVDLSHTTVETMKQVLAITKAPVVWTHAGARELCDHPRNVPDEVLRMIGDGPHQNHGVIQSIFYPHFISSGPSANLSGVADHIEHIASIAGKKHVGIASDFDGMYTAVEGLEDASKYPHLVAELLARGWSEDEMRDILGGNLMRVMDEVDALKEQLKDKLPSSAIWEKRNDLPATGWGMVGNVSFFPVEVQRVLDNKFPRHDEL